MSWLICPALGPSAQAKIIFPPARYPGRPQGWIDASLAIYLRP
jgi:hypothetical protein